MTETRYYVVDLHYSPFDANSDTSDTEFMLEAEKQGRVYTKDKFESAFNEEEINSATMLLRIRDIEI